LRWAERAANAPYGTGITYSLRPFVGKVQRETAIWENYVCIKIAIIGGGCESSRWIYRTEVKFQCKISVSTVMCFLYRCYVDFIVYLSNTPTNAHV